MKRFASISIFALFVVAIVATRVEALPAIGELQKMYDKEKVTAVKCIVKEVGRVSEVWGPIKGMSYGINLKVKTDTETLTVYLGPAWFIERQNVKFEKDDIIEVKGCKKNYNGESVIVVQEIKKGGYLLRLRDENGSPLWANAKIDKVSY